MRQRPRQQDLLFFSQRTAVDGTANVQRNVELRQRLLRLLTNSTPAVAMSRLIRDTLDATYPSYKERFDARYASLVNECSQADGRLKQLIWKASNRAFVAADTMWSDAARDYGLRIIVRSALKTLDLGSTDAAATITAWGAAEATRVAILGLPSGGSPGIDQRIKGAVVCYLDAMGKTASGSFVSWLEGQLTLLGSALGM